MRVAWLPQDVDAAGCYRCVFPASALAGRGHVCDIPPFVLKDHEGNLVPPMPGRSGLDSIPPGFFEVGFLADQLEPCDVVVVHAGAHVDQVTQARRLQDLGAKVVVDLDDTLFHVPKYNPAMNQNETYNRKWQRKAVEMADLVTCATDALAEFYSRFNPNVMVLRNRLHWPMWENIDRGAGWRRFRVGYMGNMDYHRQDLETIAPQLRRWLEANPDVEFVAAGDPRIHDVVGTPPGQRVSTSKVFFRNLDLPYVTACFDVGIVPLVRNAFNECKSWLKGLEYAACGIPCVATPTHEYREWVVEGETGYLARWPKVFIEALETLHMDRALVHRMGVRARERAQENALSNWVHEWEAAYDGTLHGGGDHAHAARETGVAA